MGFVIHCISRRMKPSQDFSVNLEEKYVSSKEALCQMWIAQAFLLLQSILC